MGLSYDAFRIRPPAPGEADVMVSAGGAGRAACSEAIDAERSRPCRAGSTRPRRTRTGSWALRVRQDAATAVTTRTSRQPEWRAAALLRDEAAITSERAGRVVVAEQWAKLDAECRGWTPRSRRHPAAGADRIRADKGPARRPGNGTGLERSGRRSGGRRAPPPTGRCRDEAERLTSEQDAFVAIETACRKSKRIVSPRRTRQPGRDRRARTDTPVLPGRAAGDSSAAWPRVPGRSGGPARGRPSRRDQGQRPRPPANAGPRSMPCSVRPGSKKACSTAWRSESPVRGAGRRHRGTRGHRTGAVDALRGELTGARSPPSMRSGSQRAATAAAAARTNGTPPTGAGAS